MSGLKQFRHLPTTLKDWSRWMRDQDIEGNLGNPDATERVLSSDTDGNREWVRRFDRWPAQFRGVTTQSLSTSASTIDLATTDLNPSVKYGLDADTVLIETAGHYRIGYTVYASVDSTAGSADCNVLAWLTKNGSAISGSYAASYLSEVSTPDSSCDGSVMVLLSAGNAVTLQAQLSAAMDVSTVADRCKLIIERVR